MSNKRCELKESSHNWIGDTCTDCGIAWSVWAKNTIGELERQVEALTTPDPDTPRKAPVGARPERSASSKSCIGARTISRTPTRTSR